MDLSSFFSPSSIAIVGVSHDPKKVGHLVANNLLKQGYKGEVYFINKDASKPILGKKVHADIQEIKKPIDLVVLAVPSVIALAYLDILHTKGIKNVVLFAAGFKEVGPEGLEREQELLEKCKAYGIRLLGPNCIGYVNTISGVNTTFLKDVSPKGDIAFISQSGALGSILNDFFSGHANVGFSYFVSLGNKSIMDECDVLEYMTHDPHVEVIAMYLEDVKDGKRFMNVLAHATAKKPVIILKSGTTTEGSQAAVSHTGGMVGEDAVYTAAIRQSGAIRADSFREFAMLLVLASFGRLPKNRNVLVLSNAGGAGVLLTDQLIEQGLNLVTVSELTKKKIAKEFGDGHKVTVRNPIDLLGDASSFDYKRGIELTMKEKDIGSVIVLLSPQANTEIMETARVIVEIQNNFKEPIYPIFMGGLSVMDAADFFEKHKMISFTSFDLLPMALHKLVDLYDFRGTKEQLLMDRLSTLSSDQKKVKKKINRIEVGDKAFLDLTSGLQLIEKLNIPVIVYREVTDEVDLRPAAKNIGYPLVAKINSPEITHKTEIQGVVTNIRSYEELLDVFKRFKTYEKATCILQPMVEGVELFVGAKRDSHFGPVAVVGMGGIFAEVLKEVIYVIKPLEYTQFVKLLSEKKMGKILDGFRGKPIVDKKELFRIVISVLDLLDNQNNIQAVDLNPLIATKKGLLAVDARVVL